MFDNETLSLKKTFISGLGEYPEPGLEFARKLWDHRRTRRGVGKGGRHPGLKKFSGQTLFSGQALAAQKS